jgi:hypothetical protein
MKEARQIYFKSSIFVIFWIFLLSLGFLLSDARRSMQLLGDELIVRTREFLIIVIGVVLGGLTLDSSHHLEATLLGGGTFMHGKH